VPEPAISFGHSTERFCNHINVLNEKRQHRKYERASLDIISVVRSSTEKAQSVTAVRLAIFNKLHIGIVRLETSNKDKAQQNIEVEMVVDAVEGPTASASDAARAAKLGNSHNQADQAAHKQADQTAHNHSQQEDTCHM